MASMSNAAQRMLEFMQRNFDGHSQKDSVRVIRYTNTVLRFKSVSVYLYGRLIAEALIPEAHWNSTLQTWIANGYLRFYKGGMDKLTATTKRYLNAMGCHCFTLKGKDYAKGAVDSPPIEWVDNMCPLKWDRAPVCNLGSLGSTVFPLKQWVYYEMARKQMKYLFEAGWPPNSVLTPMSDFDSWGESLVMGRRDGHEFASTGLPSAVRLVSIGADASRMFETLYARNPVGADYDVLQWVNNAHMLERN